MFVAPQGTSDRMDEFLVLLRHRLGWLDVRGVLYADLRPQAHEQVFKRVLGRCRTCAWVCNVYCKGSSGACV